MMLFHPITIKMWPHFKALERTQQADCATLLKIKLSDCKNVYPRVILLGIPATILTYKTTWIVDIEMQISLYKDKAPITVTWPPYL